MKHHVRSEREKKSRLKMFSFPDNLSVECCIIDQVAKLLFIFQLNYSRVKTVHSRYQTKLIKLILSRNFTRCHPLLQVLQ